LNIRDYYEKTAKGSYYTAWIFLIMAIIIVGLHVFQKLSGQIWMTIPFMILSIVYFVIFRVNESRTSKVIEPKAHNENMILDEKELAAAFMPAPTLRMLLFTKQGTVTGEIRDRNMKWYKWLIPGSLTLFLPKQYGLYDDQDSLLAIYEIKAGFGHQLVVKNSEEKVVGIFEGNRQKSWVTINGEMYKPDGQAWLAVKTDRSLSGFYIQTDDEKKVAHFQKGWLPAEWGRVCPDPNTPILTFDESVHQEEKIMIFGICAVIFHHRNN
jgi:hypothetical protein